MSIASKFCKLIPVLRHELTASLFNVIDKLREIAVPEQVSVTDEKPYPRRRVSKVSLPPIGSPMGARPPASNTFSCQLAITEFNYSLDATARPSKARSRSMENLQTGSRPAVTDIQKRRQRKSYAGVPYEKRVLSELNLGSKLSLSQTLSRRRKTSVMDALRSLDTGLPSVSSAIDLTNDMLDHERGSLHQSQAQSLEQMLDVTQKKEALMAFYYTDENNRMNVTEIFDVSESTETPQTSPERPLCKAGSAEGSSAAGGNGGNGRQRRMPVY